MERHRSLSSEVTINLAGRAIAALVNILTVPIYARLLGLENYGLLGFYNFLIAFSGALDIGLPAAINKLMASTLNDTAQQSDRAKNLRAFESILWIIAGGIFLISPWLSVYGATKWIKSGSLEIGVVKLCLALSLISLGLRFPIATYQGALYGLRRHVTVNSLVTFFLLLRHGISIWALVYVRNDIRLFFILLTLFSALEVCASGFFSWQAARGRFLTTKIEFGRILNIRRFLGELTIISLAAAFLNHSDKLVLSRLLPLEQFSLYSICSAIALGLLTLSYPVFNAAYPRLTAAFAQSDEKLEEEFNLQYRLVNMFVLPVATGILACPQAILEIWSGSATMGTQGYLYLVGLTIGVTLNCMSVIPHALLLAGGRPKPIVIFNICASLVCLPAFLFSAWALPVAVPFIWAAIHFVYLCTVLPSAFRLRFTTGVSRWWLREVLLPLVISLPLGILISRPLLKVAYLPALTGGIAAFLVTVCLLLALYKDIRSRFLSAANFVFRRKNAFR